MESMILKVKSFSYEISILFFIVAILSVGTMDYNDEVKSFNQYCADVSDGIYPDYNGTYSKCNKTS